MKVKQVIWLLRKDFRQEWRQRFTLQGILLYAVAAVFVVFLSVQVLEKPSWNALFWVILLFSGVSAVAKSFLQESRGKMLYYHQMMNPASMIVAKIIYNSLLMMGISVLCFLVYSLLLRQMADEPGWFLLSVLLGSMSFSAVLTMVSAIASKTGNGALMMPVLGIPLLIPFLLVAVRASKKAVDGLDTSLLVTDLLGVMLFFVIALVLGIILYPFLWKE